MSLAPPGDLGTLRIFRGVKDRRTRVDAKKWLGGRLVYMGGSLTGYVKWTFSSVKTAGVDCFLDLASKNHRKKNQFPAKHSAAQSMSVP